MNIIIDLLGKTITKGDWVLSVHSPNMSPIWYEFGKIVDIEKGQYQFGKNKYNRKITFKQYDLTKEYFLAAYDVKYRYDFILLTKEQVEKIKRTKKGLDGKNTILTGQIV